MTRRKRVIPQALSAAVAREQCKARAGGQLLVIVGQATFDVARDGKRRHGAAIHTARLLRLGQFACEVDDP